MAVGDDYQAATDVMQVTAWEVHPNYDPADDANPKYDFAMIRAAGANIGTPWILPMAPIEEIITSGTQIEHVGYGITSVPNGFTTRRYSTFNNIDQVGLVLFNQGVGTSGPAVGLGGAGGGNDFGNGTVPAVCAGLDEAGKAQPVRLVAIVHCNGSDDQ